MDGGKDQLLVPQLFSNNDTIEDHEQQRYYRFDTETKINVKIRYGSREKQICMNVKATTEMRDDCIIETLLPSTGGTYSDVITKVLSVFPDLERRKFLTEWKSEYGWLPMKSEEDWERALRDMAKSNTDQLSLSISAVYDNDPEGDDLLGRLSAKIFEVHSFKDTISLVKDELKAASDNLTNGSAVSEFEQLIKYFLKEQEECYEEIEMKDLKTYSFKPEVVIDHAEFVERTVTPYPDLEAQLADPAVLLFQQQSSTAVDMKWKNGNDIDWSEANFEKPQWNPSFPDQGTMVYLQDQQDDDCFLDCNQQFGYESLVCNDRFLDCYQSFEDQSFDNSYVGCSKVNCQCGNSEPLLLPLPNVTKDTSETVSWGITDSSLRDMRFQFSPTMKARSVAASPILKMYERDEYVELRDPLADIQQTLSISFEEQFEAAETEAELVKTPCSTPVQRDEEDEEEDFGFEIVDDEFAIEEFN